MPTNEYERKPKPDRPVIAVCYDFDKTLTPTDMQAQGYIQAVGYDVPDFWLESNRLAEKNDMDQNLAYMYKMIREAEGNLIFTRDTLEEYGSRVTLYPGVKEWFARIREYGETLGVIVEHYIISSGLKEMIDGTSVAGEFERIYASSFYYNERGVAQWPAQVVNYTNKTQFLFRIEKGVLDVNDPGVNEYFPPEDIRVPFRNMIYIGDSDTDIPCMKLVNANGGHSIGVYDAETREKTKVYQMMRDGRIGYFAPADYREGSELDTLVKTIVDRTAANERLVDISFRCREETARADMDGDSEKRRQSELILSLKNSKSFASTHMLMKELRQIGSWSREDAEQLFHIALTNGQVRYILTDPDVSSFYESLLSDFGRRSEKARAVEKLIRPEKQK